MINLQRAQRKMDSWQFNANTPSNVGPGMNFTNASQFDHKKDAPAPFATTEERTLTKELNANPGPGTYKQTA